MGAEANFWRDVGRCVWLVCTSRLSRRHSVYRRQKSLEGELGSMMHRAGTLMWLLAAVCLSRDLAIQTAVGASPTSPAAELTVATDSGEPRTTTASKTLSVERSATDVGAGRFCNQTISYTLKTDCKPCSINAQLRCPDGHVQLTQVSSHIPILLGSLFVLITDYISCDIKPTPVSLNQKKNI